MKSFSIYIILLIFLVKGVNLYGQQGNVWAFGYHSGLDFNFIPPKPITTSIQYPNEVGQDPAFSSSSISDCRGQLLFYGTSATVFNRKHSLMPHGLLNGGCGAYDIFIFPIPGDTNRYYYLYKNGGGCNEPSTAKDTGLYYSIIDMTLDGGYGDVDSNYKAIKIGKFNGGYTVAKNGNGRDYWLIRVQSNDSIYVYPITLSGIRNPIKQKISPLAPGNLSYILKCNHKADRILLYGSYTWNTYLLTQYSFNNTTGAIKSPVLFGDATDTSYKSSGITGIEYSPNDSELYIALNHAVNAATNLEHQNLIFQYLSYSSIESSRTLLFAKNTGHYSHDISFELGPDNKLYWGSSWDSSLGIISYPNKSAKSCNLQENIIDLRPGVMGEALPNIYAPVRNLYWQAQTGCQDSVAFINKSDTSYFKSFKWYFGDGDSSIKVNPKHPYAKAGKYYIKLMGENACGAKMWYNDSIIVNIPAHSGISIDSVKYTCLQAHFYGHRTVKDTDQSYVLDYGDSSATDSGATYSHTYTKSGTYTLTQAVKRGPCVDTIRKQISISIEPMPVAAFSMADSAGCTPYAASFKNSSKSAAHYLWKFDNGKTDTLSAPTPILIDTGYHSVKLIVTGKQGCKDSIIKQKAIYVAAVPVAGFTYKLQQVCGGIKCTVTNTSKYANRYVWDFGDKVPDTSVNPVHLYVSEGAYRISLKCSNKYCSDTTSQPVSIPKPYPRGASFSAPSSACIGKAIKFDNHSDHSMKCHWDFGDNSTDTAFVSIHSYLDSGTYPIKLLVQNPAGCIDSLLDTIVIKPAPKAVLFTQTIWKDCKNYNYTFLNQSWYADSFRYDAGDGVFVTPKDWIIQQTFTTEGTYKLRLVAFTKDCTDTETVKLTIKFAPDAPAHFLGKTGSTTICRNSGITFKALGGKSFTYKWDLGDGNTDTVLTVNHVYVNPGEFKVKLTAYNADGCFFTDSTIVTVLDTFKASIIQDKSKGCSPLAVSFKSGVIQKDAPFHYLWDFGDKQKDTTANPVHVFKSSSAMATYRVRLRVSNGYCSDTTSSVVSIQNINPQAASAMRLATVVNNSSIFLTWNSNSAASKYRVYKKAPIDALFNKIADVSDTFYTDTKVDVNTTAYCYKVQPLDECGNEGTISSEACPILLSGKVLDKNDSRSELNWNTYRSFLFSTDAENVYKDGKLLSSPVYSPFDDDSFYSADSGIHRYWIEATEMGTDLVSRSNTIRLIESVHLWIPNVFTPNQDERNDGFEISTSGMRQMHTTIYNRWGERMYETDDLHPKWDGRWQGAIVPEGVFFYTVTGLGNDGEHISRKGTVTVLR